MYKFKNVVFMIHFLIQNFKMFAYTVIISSLLCIADLAKILVVVPTPSISHQVVFRPLIAELINRHHEVTFLTTDPIYPRDQVPSNLSEVDLHDLSYGLWNKMLSDLPKNDQRDILSEMKLVFLQLSRVFEEQLKHKSVQKLLRDKKIKFDLLIVEACVNPALIYSHIFKAPLIQMSSFEAIPGNMEVVGAPTHPFLYPTIYHQKLYNLTTWEKINELQIHLEFIRMLKKQEENDNIMLRRMFGVEVPALNQLKNNVHMLFLNVHPIWLHGQPVPPNVIFTWGIHKVPEKPLSEDLQSYLDSSTNGAIYVSFGTNVKPETVGAEKLKVMLKVFSQLPYNILWKWDLAELPGKSDNIRISKWFPQVDILRHPNLKLFVTQGGLQSTDEAINAAVPLIGIPMFADQAYNTAKYEYFKIGKQLDFNSLSEQDLQMAIRNIFKNHESYKRNIITLQTQMRDQPKPPLENAIWWIEYVLRHGGAQHLRAPAASMAWTEYYELELVLVVLTGFIVLVALLVIAAYFCYKSLSYSLQRINKTKLS